MAGNKGIVSSQFYKFNAANRTITFTSDYSGLDLGEIAYITNIKNGVATVIYDPFNSAKGGTLSGLTLTLSHDTTLMSDSDPLQIITGFTPIDADPLPVKIVENADQKDDTALLQNISDNLDYLNLSLDQTEGIQVNTREINPAKRDVNNAQLISDGVQASYTLAANNASAIVDTSGYQSVEFACLGLTGANLTVYPEVSADGSTWSTIPYMNLGTTTTTTLSGGTTTIVAGTVARLLVSAITKYVRLRLITLTTGAVQVISTLKQTSLITGPYSTIPFNVSTIGGTGVVNVGNYNTANSLGSIAGTLSIGGTSFATQNPPNAATTLQPTVPHPIGIAGREQPYIGNLAGLFRYLTVDGGGRYILGGDTPDTETRTQSKLASGAIPGIPPRGVGAISNNMVGSQNLTVADTSQSDGDTNTMLLKQILTELRILNQQFAELPTMINQPSYELSDPQEYRNDITFQ